MALINQTRATMESTNEAPLAIQDNDNGKDEARPVDKEGAREDDGATPSAIRSDTQR